MKKIISLAVALIMVLALVPAIASAQVTEVFDKVGILAAMAAGGEVRLGADILIDDAGLALFTGNTTLDLFGHTLTFTASDIRYSGANAKLTVQDSSAGGAGKIVSTGGNCLCVVTEAELVINGGNIEAEKYGVFVAKAAKLTMNAGTIKALGEGAQGIAGNGTAGSGDTVITINGGTIESVDKESTDSLGIYHPQNGTLSINGGRITGGTGITMVSGTLNMTGGTVTGMSDGEPDVENSNGSKGCGSALCLTTNMGYQDTITVNITGGVLNSTYTHAIAHYKHSNAGEATKINEVNVDNATLTTPMASAVFGIEPEKVTIGENANIQTGVTTLVRANASPTFVVIIPALIDFGELVNDGTTKTQHFDVELESALLDPGAEVAVFVTSDFTMNNSGAGTLPYWLERTTDEVFRPNAQAEYCTFTEVDVFEGFAKCVDELTQAGAYTDTMVFGITYRPVG